MKDCTNGKLVEALAIATKKENSTLKECLDRLKAAEQHLGVETNVMVDFAPLSFYFERIDKDGSRLRTHRYNFMVTTGESSYRPQRNFLNYCKIIKGIDLIQTTGVDKTHEEIPDICPVLCFIEQGIYSMKDREF